jgi:hypothetical protein
MIHDTAITITVQGKPPVATTVPVKQLDDAERGGRAFKVAMILAAIGVGSVFVPVVHFFLPWIMLTCAFIAYVKIRGQGAMLMANEVQCPSCDHGVALPEQAASWPLDWNCQGCRKRLKLELARPAPLPPRPAVEE